MAEKKIEKTNYFQEIIKWIKEKKPSKDDLAKYKVKLCKKLKISDIPTDIEIYLNASEKDMQEIRQYIETKPTRTGSGVAVIATMTQPSNCPHGSCTYCPGGINSVFGNVPKSYTGKEPSTMRGIRNDYDPYRIIFNRLEQYIVLGQNPEKVEQIIMGGTFCALAPEYMKDFIYFSFKAYNDFSKLFYKKGELDLKKIKEFFELPGDVNDKSRASKIKSKVMEIRNFGIKSLEEEQKINETAAIRCIGLTVETRPDYGYAEQGIKLLELGVTRVELGVQTVYDDILKAVNRGYTTKETKKSICELRDLGFKLNFHMMPGLPTKEGDRIDRIKDITNLKKVFDDKNYRPDMLKIYPAMVMAGTPLEELYNKGIFKPLSTEEAADIIVEAKRFVPEYCRIMRIQRDIPSNAIVAGVDKTNLRQYVQKISNDREVFCRCIRCREIKKEEINGKPEIIVREYEACKGKEFFISAEIKDKILGFVRLRLPTRSLHPAITLASGLIRELHVYGSATGIGKTEDDKTQHHGIGKKLMAKAEEIAKKEGKNKMIIISGVGVREYYKKLGYQREGPYMVKSI
jgi:elongator complex protein 3